MRQTSFSFQKNYKKEFGGSLLHGKRKSARPLSTKHPLHLILKTTGQRFFNPTNLNLEKLLHRQAKKYGIKVYDLALNWSHIHMLLKIPSRASYLAFIRTLTALIVQAISKHVGKNLKGLFDLRPFTRIVTWGRAFEIALKYLKINQLESIGLISRNKVRKKPKRKPRVPTSPSTESGLL